MSLEIRPAPRPGQPPAGGPPVAGARMAFFGRLCISKTINRTTTIFGGFLIPTIYSLYTKNHDNILTRSWCGLIWVKYKNVEQTLTQLLALVSIEL